MKTLLLDSGPVITLALNNLLWLFEEVKTHHNIKFYITEAVKKEIIDNPLTTKKFKLEALQVLQLVNKGTIEVITNKEIAERTDYLLHISNSIYTAKNRLLKLVHYAEMSAVAAALIIDADAVMIDERTTRYMIERPKKLSLVMQHKMHTKVMMDKQQLSELKKGTKRIRFIRSAEFVTVAFEKGLLDDFLPHLAKSNLLDALLWGLKLNGCAISKKDLEAMERLSLKQQHSTLR
ncbi:hypothetical protein GOV09_04375 [Candidatus Woesearchaeota archaeon]|nr:hypothetical protein [Candidatus Woesearchaeota archaeon]